MDTAKIETIQRLLAELQSDEERIEAIAGVCGHCGAPLMPLMGSISKESKREFLHCYCMNDE